MPAFAVSLNGNPLVTVSAEGLNLLDVRVSGDRLGPEVAQLDVTGGAYDERGRNQYLIWEDLRELGEGDSVRIEFVEHGKTSRPGKTIDDLYPGQREQPQEPFAPVEEMVRELSQRPKSHEHLAFRFTPPVGEPLVGQTQPEEHGLSFWLGWNSFHPTRARASVRTYTLESIATRTGGRDWAQVDLQLGQAIAFRVGA